MGVKESDDAQHELNRATADLERASSAWQSAVARLIAESPGLSTHEIARRLSVSADIVARSLASIESERLGHRAEAVQAFADALEEILGAGAVTVDAARRAGILAASEQAWENELGPLLNSTQVRELLGVSRQRVDELLKNHRLIGLRDTSSRWRYPGFQFSAGRPMESLVAAFWTVAESTESDWTAALWCVSPDEELDELTPVQWAREERDPEMLLRAALRDAAPLAW